MSNNNNTNNNSKSNVKIIKNTCAPVCSPNTDAPPPVGGCRSGGAYDHPPPRSGVGWAGGGEAGNTIRLLPTLPSIRPCRPSLAARVHVPSDSFGGLSPERKAAEPLRRLFTFAAARIILAQLEGSGRGDLASYNQPRPGEAGD